MEPWPVLAPSVDEPLRVGDEQPRSDGDANQGRNHPACCKADALRCQIDQGVRNGDYVGCDVRAEGRQYKTCHHIGSACTFAGETAV